MTPAGLLYAVLSIHRGASASAWETCSTLLPWLAPDADVIAATLPGSHLERGLRARVTSERLFLHPAQPPAAAPWPAVSPQQPNPSAIPIRLGDHDRDGLAAPTRPWPARATRDRMRVRSLDTLYAATHRPGLLVIENAADAVAILGGAARFLRHDPMILIGLGACRALERAALWEDCARLLDAPGYAWFDGLLLPCETAVRRLESVTVCANAVICALPRAIVDANIAGGIPLQAAREDASIAAMAWNGWSGLVPPDPAWASRVTLSFDDVMPAYGLHPAESDGMGHWWRWSGPTAHVRFTLPMPAAGQWFLRLEVFDWGVASDASQLRVFIQGEAQSCDEFGAGGARFGPLAIAPQETDSALTVDVITPAPRRASNDDPRRIGVNFSRCVLERAA